MRKQPPMLIDTHCHLDDAAFDGDRDAVLVQSVRAGVAAWINVGYHPARWASTIELANATVGMTHMLGVHPQHADEWSGQVGKRLSEAVRSSGALAVGEIGLDYARGMGDRDVQRRAFAAQLELAAELGLGAVIHQRGAGSEVAEILNACHPTLPVLLHSFDGSDRLHDLARDRGYMIGVGGLATRRQSEGLREQLRRIPLGSLVLETDSPYLLPSGQTGRRNTPAQIATIAHYLAELKGESLVDVAIATTNNARRFFGPRAVESLETGCE